jgi:catechol 2,3-dioxygenase-like lactoylglutathione lyase family enzyme
VGDGAVILTELPEGAAVGDDHGVEVRVEDVDAHHALAVAAGAAIERLPETYPYGERQYVARDPDGHRWIFTQSVDDADPAGWGATDVHLEVDRRS